MSGEGEGDRPVQDDGAGPSFGKWRVDAVDFDHVDEAAFADMPPLEEGSMVVAGYLDAAPRLDSKGNPEAAP